MRVRLSTSERVLIVSNLWTPAIGGGAEAHAVALADHLRARGHQVGVVTIGIESDEVVGMVPPRPYRPDEFQTQTRLRRAAFHALDVYRPATARVLAATIKEFSPTVVHSHAVAGLSSTVLSAPSRLGVAHVHTLHDYWLVCQRRSLTRRDGARCERRCTGCRVVSTLRNSVIRRHPPGVVIAVSRAIADVHVELEWMRPRVRVIPNPTEPAARTRVPHSDTPTFGYIGRLTVEKGVRTLLSAFADADIADAPLLVAGGGPLADEASAAADRVEMLGWVDGGTRDDFFSRIDCLVVPSEWLDPAPLVVNEARARGIPVIGARIGGIPELVSERSASLLFPAGDAAALRGRLEAFAGDPAGYVDDEVSGLMTWERHLDLVEQAYADARSAGVGSA
jgi:glycosyltransferase involved in cell wall biosynthesis